MSAFPLLGTGAVTQYPTERVTAFSTAIVTFLDGSEQRFRERYGPARKWVVRLDLLSDEEMSRLEEFFLDRQGQAGSFEFVDPWTASVYADCSFDQAAAERAARGFSRLSTVLVIRENGS